MLRVASVAALIFLVSGCGAKSDTSSPSGGVTLKADDSITTIEAGPPSKAFLGAYEQAREEQQEKTIAMATLNTFEPADDSPAGRRAFENLGKFYLTGNAPPLNEALDDLNGDDTKRRAEAGRYIRAIFVQSLEDISTARGNVSRQISWGGGTRSNANELRNKFAELFGQKAQTPEAFESAMWLVEHDPETQNQAHGATALCRIKTAESEATFGELLARPHPNRDVLLSVIAEAAKRQSSGLTPEITKLTTHYRETVRTAAANAAATLGVTDLPQFKAELAFTPWWNAVLENIATMVEVPIPADAPWVELIVTRPHFRKGRDPIVSEYFGWLIETSDTEYRLLTEFGYDFKVDKKLTEVQTSTLAAHVENLLDARKGTGREAMERLSRQGSFSGQFEAGCIGLPEGLVAAWLYERGDKALTAKLLFPRIEAAADDRWIFDVMQDLLGTVYQQRMLVEYSHHRNYERAGQLASHLSKAVFDGYSNQPRAKQLLKQLAARNDDFKTFRLPTPDEWMELKGSLSRVEQIEYLAKRLPLLNCIQSRQPDVSYRSQQFADPVPIGRLRRNAARSAEDTLPPTVINPHNELLAMQLRVAELPKLVPFLADEQFMPTFSFWRDFHPSRTLHQVNWVVEKVINATAKRELAATEVFDRLDEAGRLEYLGKVVEWCEENRDKSPEDLLIEVLESADSFGEFARAAGECIELKITAAARQVAIRAGDFPRHVDDIAELCFLFDSAAMVPQARKWIMAEDEGTRFWSSLILVRHGDRRKGLSVLQRLLTEDDGSHWYPRAIEPLLNCRDENALKLAAGILSKANFEFDGFHGSGILQRLFLAGRIECLEFLCGKLDSPDALDNDITAIVAEWNPQVEIDLNLVSSKAADQKLRGDLKKWLKVEFAKIKAGQPHTIRTIEGRLRFGGARFDVP